jgi:glutamate-1-semialdehyde 2,1-aminomutase
MRTRTHRVVSRDADARAGDLVSRWAAENPRSAALNARARRVLPGGVTHDVRLADPFPPAVARAVGSRKWDLDHHELICYVMGHGALLFGHGHPAVVAAVQEQAARSFHPGACHELESEWAELVTRLVPSAEMVRFTSSGTEASLLALRLARAATGRDKIVKLEGHFHGWHDQVATGSDPPFDRPDTAGLPHDISHTVTVVRADEESLAAALQANDAAALILEPSGAAWATAPLPDSFLHVARRLADASGTMLIFDEVVTGFRWAPGGVQEIAGVSPDLTVLGKILAGGMPGGAVCGGAAVMDLIGKGRDDPRGVAHPGTHNAHPLSAAAGVTTLGLAASGHAQTQAAGLAARLRSELDSAFERRGVAGCAYGESSTFHLFFGDDRAPGDLAPSALKRGVPPRLSTALHCGMLTEGVHLFHGSGFLSTEHDDRDLDHTVRAFATVLPRLQAEGLL